MSSTKGRLYPCNPLTARGASTKLSSSGSKVVYTNGTTVIIRDLADSAGNVSYSGHVQPTSVARISPSGYYCASGDQSGTVRIWDTAGGGQALKNEVKLGFKINDLEWDGESKRIIAVGEGRDRFGHAFTFDSGNSAGEMIGHSKGVNAVSIRHQRPFRAATAGDDNLIIFYEGVPFKYQKTIKTHSRFVQDVRFAPSGDLFASVGSDAKIFLYDGKIGETVAEMGTDGGHASSVMACSWSPDSKSLITSSTDCTVKLWDVETRKAVSTWTVGSGISHQQVGNAWSGEEIVSLSMSGDLNVFDRKADKPTRVLYGPQRAITAFTVAPSGTLYAGSYDGRVVSFTANETVPIEGAGHTGQVTGLACAEGKIYSSGFDDCVRQIDIASASFTSTANSTTGQPKAITCDSAGTVFVVTPKGLESIKAGKSAAKLSLNYAPSAVAASSKHVAVGSEDQKVYLFDRESDNLKQIAQLASNKGVISALSFSPDGSLLAAGDSSGKIIVYDVEKREAKISRWIFHSARISSIAWTADGKHAVSGSLDTNVYVWSVEKPMRNIAIKNACPGGVSGVAWLGSNAVAAAGADGCTRTWEITFHA